MEAGKELDALVAEKVMGIESKINKPKECPICQSQVPDDYFHFVHRLPNWTCLSSHRTFQTPAYSTDIAAAWEVVEKIAATGERFNLNSVFRDPNSGKWYFTSFDRDGDFWPEEPGVSAPHAICLAALKAVGHDAKG